MTCSRFLTVLAAGLLATAGLALGGRTWSVQHVQRWTGRSDLGFVSCNHCHGQSIDRVPWAKARPRHAAPAGLAVSNDGRFLYIALDDLDEIVEADTSTRSITRRLQLPGRPFALALGGQGHLFIACRDSDEVVALDLARFKVTDRIGVGEAPVALSFCSTKAGDRLLVANSLSDDVSVLAVAPLREISRPSAGREPYAIAVTADGAVAFVANRLAVPEHPLAIPHSELTILEPTRGRVRLRVSMQSAHLSEGTVAVPGRGWSLTPIVKVRNLVPITQVANGWVMSSGLMISDPQGNAVQLPLDEANDYFADPSGVAVDPAGARAYVAAGGSDVVSVLDLQRMADWLAQASPGDREDAVNDLTLSPEYVLARVPTGRNPRHLVLSDDGKTLFVSERLQDSVLLIDTTTLRPQGRIVLGDGGANDPIRRGERVFTQAGHTFQRQFSCRSCHPDGHVDGLSYDFDGDGIGDNLLDNRSLLGLAATEPFKWTGKNPSLEVQCGPRFARVLMRTDPIPAAHLMDLTKFLTAQPPPRWARRRGKPLTPAQQRGERIFFATVTSDGQPIPRERRCATCHRPPFFTNRLPSAVGTKGARDSTDLFDTPHLLGIAYSAPYLHDGRAKTLEELWTVYQTNDLHGVSSYMNKHQLNDLVEYLKTL